MSRVGITRFTELKCKQMACVLCDRCTRPNHAVRSRVQTWGRRSPPHSICRMTLSVHTHRNPVAHHCSFNESYDFAK